MPRGVPKSKNPELYAAIRAPDGTPERPHTSGYVQTVGEPLAPPVFTFTPPGQTPPVPVPLEAMNKIHNDVKRAIGCGTNAPLHNLDEADIRRQFVNLTNNLLTNSPFLDSPTEIQDPLEIKYRRILEFYIDQEIERLGIGLPEVPEKPKAVQLPLPLKFEFSRPK